MLLLLLFWPILATALVLVGRILWGGLDQVGPQAKYIGLVKNSEEGGV